MKKIFDWLRWFIWCEAGSAPYTVSFHTHVRGRVAAGKESIVSDTYNDLQEALIQYYLHEMRLMDDEKPKDSEMHYKWSVVNHFIHRCSGYIDYKGGTGVQVRITGANGRGI